jgi:hypothetical protein
MLYIVYAHVTSVGRPSQWRASPIPQCRSPTFYNSTPELRNFQFMINLSSAYVTHTRSHTITHDIRIRGNKQFISPYVSNRTVQAMDLYRVVESNYLHSAEFLELSEILTKAYITYYYVLQYYQSPRPVKRIDLPFLFYLCFSE